MKQEHIKFSYEARYFQSGEINTQTKRLIFVLHGYGQQAPYFIRKFNVLDNTENCIIAPEGLSRFYLEGFSGRVGATWMTKEDRLTDIKNYITYLNTIYSHLTLKYPHLEVDIIGFSQGAATASRWIADGLVNAHKFILWAGIFPPDMDVLKAEGQLKNCEIYYVYGTEDPFLSEEKLREMNDLSHQLHVTPEILTFNGGHDIHSETLEKIYL